MSVVGLSASLALLLSAAFGAAGAIRPLKEGPLIDAEGREYKSAPLGVDAGSVGDESRVRVACTDTSMVVVVKADLYQNGHRLSPEELFLGGAEISHRSRCQAAAAGDAEYVIEAQLQDCGSTLTISEDSVIYSNQLVILPAARYPGITRTNYGVVPVSCHYKRTHFVSSHGQQLAAPPSPSKPPAAFSLTLMSDDWTGETLESVFYLGDVLHLQASYTGADRGQRRLLMDGCVATLSPDAASVPRYYVIENHGCLTDAKQGGWNSRFRPRRRADSLQLQLGAFLFHHDSRKSMFITCRLKASSEVRSSSQVDKACNYDHSRWTDVDGNDHACQCCDGTCDRRPPTRTNQRRLDPEDTSAPCGTVTLGPLTILPSK